MNMCLMTPFSSDSKVSQIQVFLKYRCFSLVEMSGMEVNVILDEVIDEEEAMIVVFVPVHGHAVSISV